MMPKPSESDDRRDPPVREEPRAVQAEPTDRAPTSHWAFLAPLWPGLAPSRQEFVLA